MAPTIIQLTDENIHGTVCILAHSVSNVTDLFGYSCSGIHVSRQECKWVGNRVTNFLSESCAYFLVVPVFVQLQDSGINLPTCTCGMYGEASVA